MSERAGTGFEIRVADWLGPREAQRRVLERCRPLGEERVPLAEALGRALAEPVHADATLPPWDNAAMDGYAVRGEEVRGASATSPVALSVRGRVRAGETPEISVGPGEAVRIMTGAPIPPGADSVVRVEDTDAEAEPGSVRVLRDRDIGANVRPGGQDARPGELILGAGDPIHAGTVGVLAALGRAEVWVHVRPLVAILTTGDELRGPEAYDAVRIGAGVPESNGPMLAAAVAAAGGVPVLLGIVPDDPEAIREAVARAAGADMLVTVGGASMGEADLVKRVLDGAGFRQDFWRVRMRPGSPFSFGWLPRERREQPVFGLPGNPTSAFVTFEVFARPYLLRLAGHRQIHRRRVSCRAAEDFQTGPTALFLRVRLDTDGSATVAHLTGPQGSGLVRGLSSAQGLAVIPAGSVVALGDAVEVILLDPGPGAGAASPLEGLEA
ncbi:MAG: molybdopterin molybdotransferase MoeA [Longimicrobiales bacterium]|nr:molybdopterin molybdotransferase MoeA [Longimicrobiales bacterium]